MLLAVLNQLGDGHQLDGRIGAGADHFVGEEGGIFVCRLAAILLEPRFLVAAFGTGAVEELLVGFVATGFFVDAFHDAFRDGFLDWVTEQVPAHGIALVPDILNELVEEGVRAAMSGNDGEGAAPLGDGLGDPIEQALVLVEGEFVHFDMAPLSGQGVWVGGQTINPPAIGELKHVGGEIIFGVQQDHSEVRGTQVEDFCPIEAVFQIQAGRDVVARGDPNIETGVCRADFEDGVEGIGFGGAYLSGFLHDSHVPLIRHPCRLGGQEPGALGNFDFTPHNS